MSTNCKHIEQLLPSFAEGDVTRDEKMQVKTHVGGCASCAESLALYTQLETSLLARRAMRPAPNRTAREVVRRLGIRGTSGVLSVFRGLPAAISASLVVAGVALLFWTTPLQDLVASIAESWMIETSPTMRAVESAINQMASLGEITLISLYCGVLGFILLMGSWMVLRYVRE